MKKIEIGITDIPGVKVGHAGSREKGSGCTAVIFEKGILCGCDVRGGSPATRDTPCLNPVMSNERIYGVMLTGGSAYGLNTCTGAMNYLTEQGFGTKVRDWTIPVVVGASIFDFPCSNGQFRPDAELGYEAAKNAKVGPVEEGSVGGGIGATVSKFLGLDRCIKGGIGTYGVQVGDLKVAAIVNVNAFGDIFDAERGTQLTGPLTEDRQGILKTEELMCAALEEKEHVSNTTVGLIITNADLNKGQMNKVASMTHNGYARAIRPVHTTFDGDTVFAATTREVAASVDVVGILAAQVMEVAIKRAVMAAEPVAGKPTLKTLGFI